MRVAREHPRVAILVGWSVLALLLVGALVGAGVSAGGEWEAAEGAQRDARVARERALEEAVAADELESRLGGARRQLAQLRRELGDARRQTPGPRRRAKRSRR